MINFLIILALLGAGILYNRSKKKPLGIISLVIVLIVKIFAIGIAAFWLGVTIGFQNFGAGDTVPYNNAYDIGMYASFAVGFLAIVWVIINDLKRMRSIHKK